MFTIVEKSSAECAKLNTANKELIDLGLSNPVQPTAEIIAEERAESKRRKLSAENQKQFNNLADAFYALVLKSIPESCAALGELQSGRLQFSKLHTQVQVEVYTGGYYSDKKTLRVVVSMGWGEKKKIYKSKTQDISKISTEVELIQKVSEATKEQVEYELRQKAREVEDGRIYKLTEECFGANKETFDAVGAARYKASLNGDVMTCKDLTITATLDQWKQIAEILKAS